MSANQNDSCPSIAAPTKTSATANAGSCPTAANEVLNALNPAAHLELERAFNLYAADANLFVAIITGSGERAFCVGTDLKELSRTGDHKKPPGGFAGITTRFNLYKPVIAAVNGLCLGGGVEIVAACDLAVASDDAQICR